MVKSSALNQQVLGKTIFLFALFPYVTPFETPYDTQPWALVTGVVFAAGLVITMRFRWPRPLWILLLIALYACAVFGIGLALGAADLSAGLRSVAAYLSVFVLAFVGYETWTRVGARLFVAAVGIWLLVAIVQITYDARFAESILPRLATGGYRGYTSLAPEPAFYAKLCVALLVVNELLFKEKRYPAWLYLAILSALVFQVVITRSGTGFLYLGIFLIAKAVSLVVGGDRGMLRRVGLLAKLVVLGGLFALLAAPAPQPTRAQDLVTRAISDPEALFESDLSVSLRLANPVLAFYGGVFHTHGLGFGLGTIEQEEVPEWLSDLLGVERAWGGRIMGGLVQGVYELGLVGVLWMLTVMWIIVISVLRNRRMRAVCLLSMLVLIPLVAVSESPAFPLLGYLVGVHLYYAYADPTLGGRFRVWPKEYVTG